MKLWRIVHYIIISHYFPRSLTSVKPYHTTRIMITPQTNESLLTESAHHHPSPTSTQPWVNHKPWPWPCLQGCQEITKYSTSVIYSEKTRIPDSVLCRSLVPTLPVPRLCITQITAIVWVAQPPRRSHGPIPLPFPRLAGMRGWLQGYSLRIMRCGPFLHWNVLCIGCKCIIDVDMFWYLGLFLFWSIFWWGILPSTR